MHYLEEKKQELKDPKETVSQSHLPNLRISAHGNFNLGGFYVYALVHTVRKQMR